MGVPAVVFHKGGLAHYSVDVKEDKYYVATLQRYDGKPSAEPPVEVSFLKEGRHCTGSTTNQELMDDLYETVKNRLAFRD